MVQIEAARRAPTDKALARKREILEGASRVFRRSGLHAAGMREIAAELGMHVGNLYYYFENRQELLAFCQEDTLTGLLELARQIDALPAPADEKLRRLVQGHVAVLNERTPGSLAHLEVEALEGEWRRTIRRRRDEYQRFVRRWIESGIDEGVLRPVDSHIAAMALLGALNWTVKWFRPDGPRSIDEIGRDFAALLLDGLRRGPDDRAPGAPDDE